MRGRAREFLTSPWLYKMVRWGLAGVILYAGILKLLDPESFGVIIGDFGLLPEAMIPFAAVGLPLVEIGAAIALLVDIRGALALITGLLLVFVVVVGYGIRLGLDIDCGCFGPGDPGAEVYGSLEMTLWRDLVMLAGTAYLYWCRFSRIESGARRRRMIVYQ